MKILISIGVLLIIGLLGLFLLSSNSLNEIPDSSETAETDEQTESEVTGEEVGNEDAVSVADSQEAGTALEFTIDSFNFGYSTEEIRVPVGTEVTINLTNSDGFHDWVVDEFDVATEKISTGETTSITFVADTSGTYEFYCSVGNHRAQGMVGNLIVE